MWYIGSLHFLFFQSFQYVLLPLYEVETVFTAGSPILHFLKYILQN